MAFSMQATYLPTLRHTHSVVPPSAGNPDTDEPDGRGALPASTDAPNTSLPPGTWPRRRIPSPPPTSTEQIEQISNSSIEAARLSPASGSSCADAHASMRRTAVGDLWGPSSGR